MEWLTDRSILVLYSTRIITSTLLAAVLIWLFSFWRQANKYKSLRSIPGVGWYPVIGTLPFMAINPPSGMSTVYLYCIHMMVSSYFMVAQLGAAWTANHVVGRSSPGCVILIKRFSTLTLLRLLDRNPNLEAQVHTMGL